MQEKFNVLVVEDDQDLASAISTTLSLNNISHLICHDVKTALSKIAEEKPGLVVTDFRLPGDNGLELLKTLKQQSPEILVVVMTAFPDVKLAVSALKGGAEDFLVKPFTSDQLLEVVRRAESRLSPNFSSLSNEIIAVDDLTKEIFLRCNKVAASDTPVLLTGESGTGKEVMAKYLHAHSSRRDKPFVPINCAAIPIALLESTLFGHEKGAFTGALKSRIGKFEQANGGTLFLDEIGEMPPELQPKLLRVLQDHLIERVGSNDSISLDIRLIAATNQDLKTLISRGEFRQDLYFRLSVFPVRIPRLQERQDDILPLARHFLTLFSPSMGKPDSEFTKSAEEKLLLHSWPGNVRELENVVKRALLLSSGTSISEKHLEFDFDDPISGKNESSGRNELFGTNIASNTSDIESVERSHILKILDQVGGNRRKAAEILKLSDRALRYKLKSYKDGGFTD